MFCCLPPHSALGRPSVVRLFMKPCSVLLISGLLLLERSEAYGTSQGARSSAGNAPLIPELRDIFGGGQSLAELSSSTHSHWNRHEEVWIEVKARTANAPNPSNPQATNELTVAVRAKSPVSTITLSLPERQICPGNPEVCRGYEFSEARGSVHQCDIAAWRQELPKSGLKVVDVKKEHLIDSCTVNNTFGDYGPAEKRRSRMVMTLRQDVEASILTGTWLVFKIKVKNPPETPTTRADSNYLANTWQVVLRSQREVLGTRVLPAPKILSLWMCSYTNWMWTAPCTARCGGGVRYQVRRLLHPPPESYPRELLVGCNAPLSQTHKCNEEACSVDCKLGEWISFADGPCSVTCGKGFEVQRRRVVEGPIGDGKLCPPHNELNVRVRYRECEAAVKCAPRCDLEDGDVKLYNTCSSGCQNSKGSSSRKVVPVIARKAADATLESCGAEVRDIPCGVECSTMHLLPSVPGRIPRIGKWTEIVLTFSLNDVAEEMMLEAPEGFDIGRKPSPDLIEQPWDSCLLKDHNLPRLKRCRITERNGRVRAVFDLFNSLEPEFPTRTGGTQKPRYEVHFYAKSPATCEGGFNSRGACRTSVPDEWHWTLHTRNNGGNEVVTEDHEQAGFEVYNDRATEWRPLEHSILSAEEAIDFVSGEEDREEVTGRTSDEKDFKAP